MSSVENELFRLSEGSTIDDVLVTKSFIIVLSNQSIISFYYLSTNESCSKIDLGDEIFICKLFYNFNNETLLIIWNFRNGDTSLKFKIFSVGLNEIESNLIDKYTTLEDLSIAYPGYIELEPDYDRLIIYNHENFEFSVWKLSEYRLLFKFRSYHEGQLRICERGIVLFEISLSKLLSITLYDSVDGSIIKNKTIFLEKDKNIEFLEMSKTVLLIKQNNCLLKLHDLFTDQEQFLPNSLNFSPRVSSTLSEENDKTRNSKYFFNFNNKFLEIYCMNHQNELPQFDLQNLIFVEEEEIDHIGIVKISDHKKKFFLRVISDFKQIDYKQMKNGKKTDFSDFQSEKLTYCRILKIENKKIKYSLEIPHYISKFLYDKMTDNYIGIANNKLIKFRIFSD